VSTLNVMQLIKIGVGYPISKKKNIFKSTTISINNIVQLFEIYLSSLTCYFMIFYHNALRWCAFSLSN